MNNHPPKYSTKLFKWFCNDSFYEELQGDLEEAYLNNLETKGRRKAKSIYRNEVLKMIRGSVLKTPKAWTSFAQLSLFQIHLKLALRNLKRNKVFSAVNIFGLAAALTICLFAVNMIFTGYQYDKGFKDVDRLYRITTTVEEPQGKMNWATSSFALKWHLDNIPAIESSTTFLENIYGYFDKGGEDITVHGYAIDRNFLKLFDFEVIEGNPDDLFRDFSSSIITDKLAQKLFGEESAIGKQSKSGSIVRAVIKIPDQRTHFNFEFLTNIEFMGSRMNEEEFESRLKQWQNYNHSYYNYFKLSPNSSIEQLEPPFAQLNVEMNSAMADGNTYIMSFQPVDEIMFGRKLIADFPPVYSQEALVILVIPIALLIILASFNYTNLSIARAIQRSKEIGIRKINGSTRSQIVGQIIVETVVFSVLALFFAILFYTYLAPYFEMYISEFSGLFTKNLNLEIFVWFFGFSLLVGILAGFLPALYFSKVSPLASINDSFKKGIKITGLRKMFVGIQLVFSTFCILFIVLSLNHKEQILKTDLGYKTSNLISFPLKKIDPRIIEAELDKIPEIESYSFSSIIPGIGGMTRRFGFSEDRMDTFSTRYATVDENFSEIYSPRLIHGSAFTKDFDNQILVDKKFLAAIHLPIMEAIDQEVIIDHYDVEEKLRIVGVLDQFIYDGLDQNELPLMIRNKQDTLLTKYATVQIQPENFEEAFLKLEKSWSAIAEDKTLETTFVKDLIDDNYSPFFNMMNLFSIIGTAIIVIALLGQFGISLYATQSRTKEIGIRRVLGANITSIITLLSKDSIRLLVLSTLICIPLIYLIFKSFIFPSIAISLKISNLYLFAALLATWLIVLSIVAVQSWKTGQINPSESLRNE